MREAQKALQELAQNNAGRLLLASNALALLGASAALLRWLALAGLLSALWQTQSFATPAALLLLASVPLSALSSYWQRRYALQAGHNCAAHLKNDLLAQVALQPLATSKYVDAGTLTTACVDLTEQIGDYVQQFAAQIWYLRLWPLLLTLVVLVAAPQLGAWLLLTLAITVALLGISGLLSKRAGDRQIDQLNQLSGYFLNAVANLPTLKLWRQVERQQQRMAADAHNLARRTLAVLKFAFLSSAVLEWAAFAMLILASWLLFVGNAWGTLELLAFFLVLECFAPLRELGQGFHIRAYAVNAYAKIAAIREQLAGEKSQANDLLQVNLELPPALRVQNLQLPIVNAQRWSFTIEAGSCVLLRGPSGCGKSSLLQVLAGMQRAPEHSIWLNADGDLASFDLKHWRGQCAYLSQHPLLLPTALAANINLAASADHDLGAITADLEIADFAEQLLHEHPTPRLGSQNIRLSGGELARVALARCLLKPSKLVLLDEPLQGVETWRRERILQRLPPYFAGRTVIICSHLRQFAQVCDRVIDL